MSCPFYHQLRDNHESDVIYDSRRNRRWHPCLHRINLTTVRLLWQTAHHQVTLYYRHHFQFTHKNMEQAFYTEQAFFLKFSRVRAGTLKSKKNFTHVRRRKIPNSAAPVAPFPKKARQIVRTGLTTRSDVTSHPFRLSLSPYRDYLNT